MCINKGRLCSLWALLGSHCEKQNSGGKMYGQQVYQWLFTVVTQQVHHVLRKDDPTGRCWEAVTIWRVTFVGFPVASYWPLWGTGSYIRRTTGLIQLFHVCRGEALPPTNVKQKLCPPFATGYLSQRPTFIFGSHDTIQAATGSSKLCGRQTHCQAQNLWLWGVSSSTVTEQKSQG